MSEFGKNINEIGDLIVGMLEEQTNGAPVGIMIFAHDSTTGQVVSTCNLDPEDFRHFLNFVHTQHKIGAVTMEGPEKSGRSVQ